METVEVIKKIQYAAEPGHFMGSNGKMVPSAARLGIRACKSCLPLGQYIRLRICSGSIRRLATESTDNQHIQVRRLQSYEREIVGHILANVFAEKYEPAFGTDTELAAEVASIVPLSGATYLALLDFQAAGTATLHTNGATGFGGYETQLMWRMVRKRLGFFGAIRAFIKLSGGVSSLDMSASYVSSVAVLPEFQRMGVATALLQRLEDDARAAGKLRIGLHVLEANSIARRLYERLGYTVEKKVTPTHMPWRRNVPVHLYMVKQLAWNRGQSWAQQ